VRDTFPLAASVAITGPPIRPSALSPTEASATEEIWYWIALTASLFVTTHVIVVAIVMCSVVFRLCGERGRKRWKEERAEAVKRDDTEGDRCRGEVIVPFFITKGDMSEKV